MVGMLLVLVALLTAGQDVGKIAISDISGVVANRELTEKNNCTTVVGFKELADLITEYRKAIESIDRQSPEAALKRLRELNEKYNSMVTKMLHSTELRRKILQLIIDSSGYFAIGNRFATSELGLAHKEKEIDILKKRVEQVIDNNIKKYVQSNVDDTTINTITSKILDDCIRVLQTELSTLMDETSYKTLKGNPGSEAYSKRYAAQKIHINGKLVSYCQKMKIDIVSKYDLHIPYSMTLLTSCATVNEILKMSDEEQKRCREMSDALCVQIFLVKSEYEASTTSSSQESRSQLSAARRKVNNAIKLADAELKASLPSIYSRVEQIRTQFLGEQSIFADGESNQHYSITEEQIAKYNTIKRANLQRSVQEKSGDRSTERGVVAIRRLNLQLYELLNDRQKELWNKRIGKRLSEKEYVRLYQEYREKVK